MERMRNACLCGCKVQNVDSYDDQELKYVRISCPACNRHWSAGYCPRGTALEYANKDWNEMIRKEKENV